MSSKYDKDSVLLKLLQTMESVPDVICKPDYVRRDQEKIVYTKHVNRNSKYSIRIVTESVGGRFEIKSIHFQKLKVSKK